MLGALLAARVALASIVPGPFLYHDEGGYAAVALALTGDGPSLFGPTYHPGLGVLLAPVAALTDGVALFRAAQALNTIAAVAVVAVAYGVARRVGGCGRPLCAAAAVAGGLSSASVVQATMLVPETIFTLACTATVLVAHRLAAAPSTRVAVAAGVVAGSAFALHPRGLVVVGALAIVLALGWRWGGVGTPEVGVATATMAVAVGATLVLHDWISGVLYPQGSLSNLAESPLGALTEPRGFAVIAAGQTWYLVVATLGLAPMGVLAAVGRVRGSWPRPEAVAAAVLLVALGGSVALGAAAAHDVGAGSVLRADQPVYGRYVEQWVPTLVALAPSVALAGWRRATLAWAVLATGAASALLVLVVWVEIPREAWDRREAWNNISSLRLAGEAWGATHHRTTGVVVAVAAVVLLGVAIRSRRWVAWMLPLSAVGLFGALNGADVVREWNRPAAQAWEARHELGPAVGEGMVVAVEREDSFEVLYAYNLQFHHPEVEVRYEDGEIPEDPDALVLESPARAPSPDHEIVAAEGDGTMALWRRRDD